LAEYETNAAYVWNWKAQLAASLVWEVMNMVLDYFIEQERYEPCEVMRKRIAEYYQQKEG
jgi:hypothetical protein